MKLRLVVHKEIPDDKNLRAGWRNLLRSVDQPQVFYTYEWALSAAHAYPCTIRPLLCAAYEQDELVGVVALSADYSNRQTCFLTATTADYCDFLCVEKHRRQFIEKVLDHIEVLGLRTLVLANLPADSSTVKVLRRVTQSRGFSVLARHAYHCAQLRFESPAERETMKHAATRKEAVRRHLKALFRGSARWRLSTFAVEWTLNRPCQNSRTCMFLASSPLGGSVILQARKDGCFSANLRNNSPTRVRLFSAGWLCRVARLHGTSGFGLIRAGFGISPLLIPNFSNILRDYVCSPGSLRTHRKGQIYGLSILDWGQKSTRIAGRTGDVRLCT